MVTIVAIAHKYTSVSTANHGSDGKKLLFTLLPTTLSFMCSCQKYMLSRRLLFQVKSYRMGLYSEEAHYLGFKVFILCLSD